MLDYSIAWKRGDFILADLENSWVCCFDLYFSLFYIINNNIFSVPLIKRPYLWRHGEGVGGGGFVCFLINWGGGGLVDVFIFVFFGGRGSAFLLCFSINFFSFVCFLNFFFFLGGGLFCSGFIIYNFFFIIIFFFACNLGSPNSVCFKFCIYFI